MDSSAPNTSVLDHERSFASHEFGLDRRLTKAVARMGFAYATLVQVHCIPLALQGKDLLVRARTGSGKTAAFGLPLLQQVLTCAEKQQQQKGKKSKNIKAVILVPTKELVTQTKSHLHELTYYCRDVVSIVALAGESMNIQQAVLRDVPDIIISTPARLLAHVQAENVKLGADSIQCLVLDEADMMLSFGYKEDIRSIISKIPKTCQKFFMSATLSPELDALKRAVLHNPAVVKLEEGSTDGKLQQFYIAVKKADKDLLLYAFIKLGVVQGKVLFFVNSTATAYRLKLFFEQFSIQAAVLNAQLPSSSRQHIIQEFNSGIFDYLIATDESIDDDEESGSESEEENGDEKDSDEESDEDEDDESDKEDEDEQDKDKKKKATKKSSGPNRDASYGVSRGVDFRGVNFVVNVDFPKSSRSYTHRIGRTARGGASGTALSLLSTEDDAQWTMLEKVQRKQQITSSRSSENLEASNAEQDYVQQPAPLSFELNEIDCFRYRVEDVRRAVTNIAVAEAQREDFKKEILNSQKLQSHFEDNPKDLNILQHDKAVGKAIVQPHLANVPSYLVPEALLAPDQKKRKKKSRRGRSTGDKKRRVSNDPLHTFQYSDNEEDGEGEGEDGDDQDGEDEVEVKDRIFNAGETGKSSAGRQRWKEAHRKGKFSAKANKYFMKRDTKRFRK